MAFKINDRVVATRYMGPPYEDAVVVKTSTEKVQSMDGHAEQIPTATIRFADGHEVTVPAGGLEPAPAFYSVTTGDTEVRCDNIAQLVEAVESYLATEGASRKAISIARVNGPQRVGTGTPVPLDNYGV